MKIYVYILFFNFLHSNYYDFNFIIKVYYVYVLKKKNILFIVCLLVLRPMPRATIHIVLGDKGMLLRQMMAAKIASKKAASKKLQNNNPFLESSLQLNTK